MNAHVRHPLVPAEIHASGPSLIERAMRAISLRRPPDFVIGDPASPYMLRWWIIPRNKWFSIYLHNMLKDDDDRAAHDHPWVSLSICIKGMLIEHRPGHEPRLIRAGSVVYRNSTFAHRLAVVKPTWTIFIRGPIIREWGFLCGGSVGWRHWKDFTSPSDKGTIGRGCGE